MHAQRCDLLLCPLPANTPIMPRIHPHPRILRAEPINAIVRQRADRSALEQRDVAAGTNRFVEARGVVEGEGGVDDELAGAVEGD
ncbi:hypothetical protein V500_07236 [Pseudogymnoascus sp. VKM F-4518 (FW-2643)]|nr:hypothetical protein V500_07236 [Pseudogymnoascus sp. VKM F-4518 (FW-2643)]